MMKLLPSKEEWKKSKVSVHVKGNRDVTEQFDINDEKIFIHIGA